MTKTSCLASYLVLVLVIASTRVSNASWRRTARASESSQNTSLAKSSKIGSRLIKNIGFVAAKNCSAHKYVIPISAELSRVIYKFNCYPPLSRLDPDFVPVELTTSSEYDELNLSPNLFTRVPLDQLCAFTHAAKLDLSFNLITNLSGAFVALECMSGLVELSFAHNRIETPIRAQDFDDSLAARLQQLDLSNNRIAWLETAAFFSRNGSSRFPSLVRLNLAKNFITDFDMLWPLSLPRSVLSIDLSLNPIDKLTNQLNVSFKDLRFAYAMTGNRRLDATTNSKDLINKKIISNVST